MGGLSEPSEGEIVLNGVPIEGETPPETSRMFQTPVLLEWRTALENVLLPIEIEHGKAGARAARARADTLLELVGLQGFEHRYPRELSGGMQQRVAMCRMLIADPEVLLLDEPFGALDELTREHLNVQLATLVHNHKKAAVLVTHNVAEAVFLADQVVVMTPRPGRIAGIIEVPFARPRSLGLLAEPEFARITATVRSVMYAGDKEVDHERP
jgi:NitT/TauT family transport system ATP-binding protein